MATNAPLTSVMALRAASRGLRPAFDVVLDGFHDHDGVIDHDADRKDDAEKRDVVDRESESRHRRESADERNRNGDERDDRRAPGLEKNKHDENDKRDGLEERLLHFVDRLAHGRCRVVDNCVVEPDGEALLELSHFLAHGVRGGKRVRARELENADRGGRFSAELAVDRVIARRKFNPCDIAHASDLSVGAGLNDDFAKFLFVGEPALRADGVLKCGGAFRHRRRADDSRRDLHILLLYRLHDILRREIRAPKSCSGSSHIRIEYSRAPKTLMSPTPSSARVRRESGAVRNCW